MAVKSVNMILRDGIINALMDPGLDAYLNRTGDYDGVYCSERFDQEDGYDPASVPFISVHMPLRVDSQSVTEHISLAQFSVDLFVYYGSERPRDAEETVSLLMNAVRVCLSSQSYTDSLRAIGGFRNAPVISDEGWGRYGQDVCFRMSARYQLAIDNSQLITVPEPPILEVPPGDDEGMPGDG